MDELYLKGLTDQFGEFRSDSIDREDQAFPRLLLRFGPHLL